MGVWVKGEREAAAPSRPHVKHKQWLRERGGGLRSLAEVGGGQCWMFSDRVTADTPSANRCQNASALDIDGLLTCSGAPSLKPINGDTRFSLTDLGIVRQSG